MSENNKPAFKYRSGSVTGTVWKNEREGKRGKFMAYDVVIERNYKVEEEWKTTSKFQENDLFDVSLTAQNCYEFVKQDKQQK